MRLFVGLIPSAESLIRIEAVHPPVLPAGSRSLSPENLHLTLVFLRDFPEHNLSFLKETLQGALQGIEAFYLNPRSLHWERKTLWLELVPDNRLTALAEELHRLVGLSLRKPFRPHLTLARLRTPYRIQLGSYPLRNGHAPLFFPEAYLFRSHLHPEGARYERLERYPLHAVLNPPL